MTRTLDQALIELGHTYTEAVNAAVAEDRMDLVAALSAEYDREAVRLRATHPEHQQAPAA